MRKVLINGCIVVFGLVLLLPGSAIRADDAVLASDLFTVDDVSPKDKALLRKVRKLAKSCHKMRVKLPKALKSLKISGDQIEEFADIIRTHSAEVRSTREAAFPEWVELQIAKFVTHDDEAIELILTEDLLPYSVEINQTQSQTDKELREVLDDKQHAKLAKTVKYVAACSTLPTIIFKIELERYLRKLEKKN